MIQINAPEQGFIQLTLDKEDIEEFKYWVTEFPELINVYAKEVAKKLREFAVLRSPVDKGTLQTSWSEVYKDVGGSYSFYAGVPYAYVLELGLYPGVGPKTVAQEGQIYSTQAVGGILAPMIAEDVEGEYTLEVALSEIEPFLDQKLKEILEGRIAW